MGKKQDQEKDKETKTPETTETQDGGIEVVLEEEQETSEPQEEVTEEQEETREETKPKPKPQEADVEAKLRNRLGYQERQIEKLQRQIQEFTQVKSAPVTETTPTDDIDKLAEKDWKAAVRKLGAEEAQRIYKENQAKIQEQSQLAETQITIEKNAQTALGRHPELSDETSEKSQIWFDVLNQNPRWRSSSDGPLLTMYKMEEELRKRGYDVDGTINKKVETEKERFIRANQANLPSSRSTTPSSKIVLTKEQRELCDTNGIKYEDYARTLSKGGSEVAL